MWSIALPLLVVLIAAATAAGLLVLSQSPKTPWVAAGLAAVGKQAPDFSSWDIDGSRLKLSDLKGRPVLVSFWATSCTACQDEFPTLQRIQNSYRSTGFTILAVDFRETNTKQMREFLDRLNVSFRTVVDPQGTIAWAYRVDIGLPVNVWLDRNHVVTQIMVGERPSADLTAAAAEVAKT
jgi:peroxiredoxin